jgi:hypothetical protein
MTEEKRDIKPHKGGRSERLYLRLTPERKVSIQRNATKSDMSVADYIAWLDENHSMTIESKTPQMFTVNTHELGWDFLPEITVSINRNPDTLTQNEWDELCSYLEESFPLTQDEIEHGLSKNSAKFFFEP